jgi:hypothetical protein
MLMNKKEQHVELHFITTIVLTKSQPSHTKKKQDLTKKIALPESSRAGALTAVMVMRRILSQQS